MPRFRLILQAIAMTVVVLGVLWAVAAALFSQQMLLVDSGDVKGDVMVILGGGFTERVEEGAQLFKAGAAPVVLVSGTGDCERSVLLLENEEVPASAIIKEDRSATTMENAEFSVPILRKMGAHRVILVTTWYHSRRAMACFKHVAPDITFYSRPSYYCYSPMDWDTHHMGSYAETEFMKLPGYWLRYGVNPF